MSVDYGNDNLLYKMKSFGLFSVIGVRFRILVCYDLIIREEFFESGRVKRNVRNDGLDQCRMTTTCRPPSQIGRRRFPAFDFAWRHWAKHSQLDQKAMKIEIER